MLGTRRVLELFGLSLFGCLLSIGVAKVFQLAKQPHGDASSEDVITAAAAMAADEAEAAAAAAVAAAAAAAPPAERSATKFAYPAALIALMIALELLKHLSSNRALSLGRVLRLESFRETLRSLVQGRGLPPELQATTEEDDASYANERARAWAARKDKERAE